MLKRQFFQLVEPLQLRWPVDQVLKAPNVQYWIFNNLFNPENVSHPPPERYQQRVLKALISNLERSIVDPEVDVWLFFHFLFYVLLHAESSKHTLLHQHFTRPHSGYMQIAIFAHIRH